MNERRPADGGPYRIANGLAIFARNAPAELGRAPVRPPYMIANDLAIPAKLLADVSGLSTAAAKSAK